MLTVAQLIGQFSTVHISGRFSNAIKNPAILPGQNQLNAGLSQLISSGSFLILHTHLRLCV